MPHRAIAKRPKPVGNPTGFGRFAEPRYGLGSHSLTIWARQCLDLWSQPLENWIPKDASSIVLAAGHQRRTTALSCGQLLCHSAPIAAFKPAPRPGAVDTSATMEHGEASADHLAPATAIRCVLRFVVALMCLTRLSCMVPRS